MDRKPVPGSRGRRGRSGARARGAQAKRSAKPRTRRAHRPPRGPTRDAAPSRCPGALDRARAFRSAAQAACGGRGEARAGCAGREPKASGGDERLTGGRGDGPHSDAASQGLGHGPDRAGEHGWPHSGCGARVRPPPAAVGCRGPSALDGIRSNVLPRGGERALPGGALFQFCAARTRPRGLRHWRTLSGIRARWTACWPQALHLRTYNCACLRQHLLPLALAGSCECVCDALAAKHTSGTSARANTAEKAAGGWGLGAHARLPAVHNRS